MENPTSPPSGCEACEYAVENGRDGPHGLEETYGACDMTSRPNLKPTLRNGAFYLTRMNASLAQATISCEMVCITTLPMMRRDGPA